MEAIKILRGTCVPLERSDVDTDQIIPSDWLKRVERTGFGEGLFSEWREDANFVLNDVAYSGASILIAGPNFGTGSSREHAVWALTDYGFKAIISPRFGDIFRNNSTKAGLLPVVLQQYEVDQIMAAVKRDASTIVVVDVEKREVRVDAIEMCVGFPLDDFTQYRLLNGLDDIGLTLQHETDITAFESRRASYLPRTVTN